MSFRIEHRDRSLHLEGEMTIYSALAMKEQLVPAVAAADAAVALDLSDVCELDTAGLQILLVAKRLAGERGRGFTLLAASAAVRGVLDLCGLGDLGREGAGGAS